jgi:small subunit ribosomal protein S18
VTRETSGSATTSRERGARPRNLRTGRPRYVPKRKVCFFCANKNETIDYKNPDKLRVYLSDRAKIEPRRRTGTCAKHQRALAVAIKRARQIALLPFVPEHVYPAPLVVVSPSAGTTSPSPPPAQITPVPAPTTTENPKDDNRA